MYKLVYGRPGTHVTLTVGTLAACAAARLLCGDLILDPQGQVVQGTGWLFSWERADPSCYARRMQQHWTH